ncbi:MAG TPA: GDP-mannose 4,6-dehydratase [Xanthomonadales bacterium]|nr:GDP-mannose 4,6-dehydratase [Xanthomonadales bacterium]
MKRVLITGATGFVGQHLTELLSANNEYEIFGTSLTEHNSPNEKVKIEKIDLSNPDDVLSLVNKTEPDLIYHLAALTSPADSFSNPTPVVLGNIEIQMNLLNAVRNSGFKPRILVVSSAEVYGLISASDLPIDESTPMRPANPYAVSKIAQDYLGLQYHLSYKMDIIRVRPFNHTGPGQGPGFVVPAFSGQIAKIEKGKQEPILKVGNLLAKRDFTDVRDIVKGYLMLMEKGVSGEVYNIGSGKSHSMQELLDTLLSLTDKKIVIENDPARQRPSDVADIFSDCKKLSSLTGWKPEIPIEKTLQDTLDYWRGVV